MGKILIGIVVVAFMNEVAKVVSAMNPWGADDEE